MKIFPLQSDYKSNWQPLRFLVFNQVFAAGGRLINIQNSTSFVYFSRTRLTAAIFAWFSSQIGDWSKCLPTFEFALVLCGETCQAAIKIARTHDKLKTIKELLYILWEIAVSQPFLKSVLKWAHVTVINFAQTHKYIGHRTKLLPDRTRDFLSLIYYISLFLK